MEIRKLRVVPGVTRSTGALGCGNGFFKGQGVFLQMSSGENITMNIIRAARQSVFSTSKS
jgi:hypothetical protein